MRKLKVNKTEKMPKVTWFINSKAGRDIWTQTLSPLKASSYSANLELRDVVQD